MRLYSLAVNGNRIVEVSMDSPAWLPIRPSLPPRWLRGIVSSALSRYFSRVVRA